VHNAAPMEENQLFLEPFEMRMRSELNKDFVRLSDRPDASLSNELLVQKYRRIQMMNSYEIDYSDTKKYPNFSPQFPCKNYNEMNIFSVKNGQGEHLENLDVYEVINNCEGF
jgi:hypothetical protein